MRLQLARPLHQPLLVECLHQHLLLLLRLALLLLALLVLLVVMSRSEAATNR